MFHVEHNEGSDSMASSFGGTVKLQGETEYRKALNQITQNLREVASEMKVVSTSYATNDKSSNALTARSQVLNKQLEEQNNKLTILKSRYDELSKTEDTNSVSMSKLRTQINQAQADVNKTSKELENLGKHTEDSGKKAEKAGDGFTVFKGVLADLSSKAITSAIGGLRNLGATLVDVGKQSLMSYADYEQLEGGVQKLFGKETAEVIKKNAQDAFKTAGLSANEYMETVTGFSASLINSLNGDTQKAAELSDQAIRDMSDNANTFGTDIASIQYAYQGFAKGNYTMLDNLKLGYSGSKQGMQQLLDKANELNREQGKHTNYQISNYGDIINAIHDVQIAQGIQGTTAKEAANTISGSMASVKGSWQNLLTAMGSGSQEDIKVAMKNLSDSIIAAMKNIIPRIVEIVKGMGEVFDTFIHETLPQIIEQLPPEIQEKIKSIQDGFKWFVDNKEILIGAIGAIIGAFAIAKIVSFVQTISGMITVIKSWELATKLQTAAQWLLNAALNANPIGLVVAAIGALVAAFVVLWNKSEGFRNFWLGLWETIKEAVKKAGEFIEECFTKLTNFLSGVVTSIGDFFGGMWDRLKQGAADAWEGIKSTFSVVADWFKNIFSRAWQNVKDVFSTGGAIFVGIKEGIVNAFKIVVNGIIGGINKVIAVPFNAINGILRRIRDIEIAGFTPFDWISLFKVPEIPLLYRGGVLKKGQMGFLEGNGAEAVVPLENNPKWISKVASELKSDLGTINSVSNVNQYNSDEMVNSFKQAIKELKIELDGDSMGKFVDKTVANAVFS